MKLTLHNYWRSSASYRVRIALGLKGLTADYVAVHLLKDGGQQRAAAHRLLNPLGQVPALVITEDDGATRVLTQSLPIIEYLEDRWPEPAVLPRDPYLRARCRALAEVVNAGIQPLQNLSTTRRLVELGVDDKAWIRTFMHDGLVALEAMTAPLAGRYSVGDAPTLADCCLVPQLYSAHRFGVPLDPFPTLTRVAAACEALPAFAAAHPDRQPDANT